MYMYLQPFRENCTVLVDDKHSSIVHVHVHHGKWRFPYILHVVCIYFLSVATGVHVQDTKCCIMRMYNVEYSLY